MSDTLEILTCPACGKDMKKVYLSDMDINIDFCENCGGLLFDNRELEKIQANSEVFDDILKTMYENSEKFKKTDYDDVRICPVCETPMVKIGTNIDDIEVDVCNACGAKYLDSFEFQKIQDSDEDVNVVNFEQIDNMIDAEVKLYEKKSRWYNFFTKTRRNRLYDIILSINNL